MHNGNGELFDILEKDIIHFSRFYRILICGEMNARTGNLDDRLLEVLGSVGDSFNIDYDNVIWPVEISVPRKSCDHIVNRYGKLLLDLCKINDL